jgi:hypothetical protein
MKKFREKRWLIDFQDLLENKSQTLSFCQYDTILKEWIYALQNEMIRNGILGIIFFCLGLWAVWANSLFIAVLLIALAAYFNRQSADQELLSGILLTQQMLAMNIHKQSMEIEDLRNKVLNKNKSTEI